MEDRLEEDGLVVHVDERLKTTNTNGEEGLDGLLEGSSLDWTWDQVLAAAIIFPRMLPKASFCRMWW